MAPPPCPSREAHPSRRFQLSHCLVFGFWVRQLSAIMGKADEEENEGRQLQHGFQAGSGTSDGGGRYHRGAGQGAGDFAEAALPLARQTSGRRQGGAKATESPAARKQLTDRFATGTQCSRLANRSVRAAAGP